MNPDASPSRAYPSEESLVLVKVAQKSVAITAVWHWLMLTTKFMAWDRCLSTKARAKIAAAMGRDRLTQTPSSHLQASEHDHCCPDDDGHRRSLS